MEPADSITIWDLEAEHSLVMMYHEYCPTLTEVVIHSVTWRLVEDDMEFVPCAENPQIREAWIQHYGAVSAIDYPFDAAKGYDSMTDLEAEVGDISSSDAETALSSLDSCPTPLRSLVDLHLQDHDKHDDDMEQDITLASNGRTFIPRIRSNDSIQDL